MRARTLFLEQYRNYKEQTIAFCPDITMLCGENAQGKTNVLEAIFLCCTGRSHRTSRDAELVMEGCERARVSLDVERKDGPGSVEMTLERGRRKQVLVDGLPIERIGEMMGKVRSVLFSPEDLRLIKDGPGERRKFMDMELSQLSVTYFYDLQQYARALRQRNALLKALQSGEGLLDTLPVWDEQLSRLAAAIYQKRVAFMEDISAFAAEIHRDISGRKESLAARFVSDGGDEAHYLKLFEANRRRDIHLAATCAGPHRDDIQLSLNGMDVRAYGSQGQQRTAALALKLSEIRLMKKRAQDPPILLLDDVFSELDLYRRRQLMEYACGVQAILTCTQASSLPQLCGREVHMVCVSAGLAQCQKI